MPPNLETTDREGKSGAVDNATDMFYWGVFTVGNL